MKRLLSVLALATLTWSQMAVLHCESGGVHGGEERHAHAAMGHGGNAMGEVGVSHLPAHPDAGCALLMACGASAVEARGATRAQAAHTPLTVYPSSASLHAVHAPGTEPPPPRVVV